MTSAAPKQSATEVLAVTIAAVVEKQLAAQQARVQQHLSAHQESQRQQFEALQAAFEQRLQELARHHAQQISDLQLRIGEASGGASSHDTEYVDHQISVLTARLDESTKTVRRFDEQASALVQHVNETTAALSRRMDEGDQALAHAVEQRLITVREMFDQVGTDVGKQIADQAMQQQSKLDAADSRVTDRLLSLEERIKEESGTKVASLEATIGRIGAGFDEAMAALSQRLLDNENKLGDTNDRLTMVADQLARVDDTAIQEIKDQLSSAIGEAMLVRIELDRVVASTDEKLGKNAVRMAEIEAKLEEETDVSAAVQLERLDELERAIVMLDPSKFVRKADTGAVQVITPEMTRPAERTAPPTTPPPAGPIDGMPEMTLNPSLSGRD